MLTPEALQAAAEALPHLCSPAALMRAFRGAGWGLPPHLDYCNTVLNRTDWDAGGARLMVNMPYQHAKSELFSRALPAWLLLLNPDLRIGLIAHEENYAVNEFGAVVKEVVDRFGSELGVKVRRDTKAKGEWKVAGRQGGMFCKGPHGGVVGRPVDLFIIDDLIREPAQALSRTILDGHWEWYKTVVFGRLRRVTSLVVVGTRWCQGDLFGRLNEMAGRTGERWQRVRFPALAECDDLLGRAPGEPLWPEQVTRDQLAIAEQEMGRWFSACWQQNPEADEGSFFKPSTWPTWVPIGGAYSVEAPGKARKVYHESDCVTLLAADWAWSQQSTADYSAIGVFALCPGGELLVLDVVNRRLAPHELAREVAACCRRWRPGFVAIEDGHPTIKTDLAAEPDVPAVRWMKPAGRIKVVRALPAIKMGGKGELVLPGRPEPPWKRPYVSQLAGFNGSDADKDDMVDMTAWGCELSRQLRPAVHGGSMPEVLIEPRNIWGHA
jgi:hypothetical protein